MTAPARRFASTLFAVGIAWNAAAATTLGRTCTAAKARAVGKLAFCRARCDERAVRSGTSVSSVCYDRCESSHSVAWYRADLKGDCVIRDDQTTLAESAASFVATLETTLAVGGPSACTAGQYRQTGKLAYCALVCHAKALRAGAAPSPACLTRCDDDFRARCAAAIGVGDCLASVPCVWPASVVDAFVDDTVAALLTPPTTTTTSTSTTSTSGAPTSTSTTTTTAPACLGCVTDGNGDGVREWLMAGDSNTTFLSCAYPIVLQARYDPRDVTILDDGLFGSSAAWWVKNDLLGPLLATQDPDAVLISLGTNDVITGTPEAAWANLEQLYHQAASWCHADGTCVVPFVATVPPIYSPPDPVDYGPAIQSLNRLIRSSIPPERVVDFDSWMPPAWDETIMWRPEDGRHLGCGGQAIRADVCQAVLDRTP